MSTTKISMKSCRICLASNRPMCPLFKYKLSGNYAEMLTAVAEVKVDMNDGLPDKICDKCCVALEKAFLLKTVAERSDNKLRRFLSKLCEKVPTKKIKFDSFNDIKTEIAPLGIKSEPKWEMEIELLDRDSATAIEAMDTKDNNIVIADTVIKKIEGNQQVQMKANLDDTSPDVTLKSSKTENTDVEFLDDDIYQDDVDDEDYVPPDTKKSKFKKPKLSNFKVSPDRKSIVRKIKVLKKIKVENTERDNIGILGDPKATTITCYPIMKNGTRGSPILLKRPKDATVLKVHASFNSKVKSLEGTRVVKSERTVLRCANKPVAKQREKLVCPVCGVLTFTLGNHMSTHQEKKRFTCPECPRTFSQRGNMTAHLKQHSGIKDHICEICGSGFYSQKSLVRHNLIHKGDRPYPCNLCNKTFIARCDLNRHLRIHYGYKPYKCNSCTMSFNAKHQLQNHERMHTGERPYTCEVCNVAFSYKVNLNNHVLKVHCVNLKFKSIHTVTEDVLRQEIGLAQALGDARDSAAPAQGSIHDYVIH